MFWQLRRRVTRKRRMPQQQIPSRKVSSINLKSISLYIYVPEAIVVPPSPSARPNLPAGSKDNITTPATPTTNKTAPTVQVRFTDFHLCIIY